MARYGTKGRKRATKASKEKEESVKTGNTPANPQGESVCKDETVVCNRIISGKYSSVLCIGGVSFTANTLGCSEEEIRRSNVTGEPVSTNLGIYSFSIVKGDRKTVADSLQ